MKRIFSSRNGFIVPLKIIAFCKSVDCPASQDLLGFQNGESPLPERALIQLHLTACEFCAAEVDFYRRFPQSEENVVSAEIPLPLFQLAEALLSNRRQKFSLLNKLLNEGKELSFN